MAESSISHQEYLLKYLSNEKKKKKTNEYIAVKRVRVQIIDDDIDIKSIQPRNVDSEPEYGQHLSGDEAPLVVKVIDERPKQIITKEEYRNSSKWKLLQSPDEESSNTPNNINEVSFEVTGLQTASSLKKFRSGEDKEIGRDAVTVFRDKLTGHKRNFRLEVMQKKKEVGEKVQAEKYCQWGKGLKQIEMNKKNLKDASNEMSKPLARYRDDVDLDKFLRLQERDGDPALLFMKKSSTINEQEKPKFKGPPPPPNRFGILPGFRWDGVDRSNGFEKDKFLRISNQKAELEHSYKWSTEDM